MSCYAIVYCTTAKYDKMAKAIATTQTGITVLF